MRVYLEDIRSPFNVGSIFRTAEALGFEEIIISPECADPLHPRALRTAMGTIERLAWRRAPISALAAMEGVFALEVGGTPLQDFDFPLPGIMVLGSEELGVSQEVLRHCSRGSVEIPLVGSKASLNVATAFGIAGFAWVRFRSQR
jgi:TrmH family RNA methyltransferase